ncbi:MAG: PEP-CTERM sorting domain-containing protein, partial [Akkermansiaceae bacterium]|nr:PEP-CTERM sorting domain-containing protein [Armatimonadota bacterium]
TVNEARAEILLPPGAVAHHASLWINGVEKPAAFGPQATVRRAYREVAVVQRRDPLLVTMPVPGKLLVQCYPIPARGTMKIRLGVTFPLLPDASDRRKLTYALPAWGGTNFANAGRLADALPVTDSATGKPPVLPLILPKGVAWSEKATARKPVNLLVALDGSEGMREVFGAREQSALREALETLPDGSTVRYTATNRAVQSEMNGLLHFEAGQDNVPTLRKKVRSELGANTILLYLHAGTPDSVSDPAPLVGEVKALSQTPESRPRFVSLLLRPDAHDTIGDRLAMQQNARTNSVALYPNAAGAIQATVESLVRGNDFPTPDTPHPTLNTRRLRANHDALAVWYRYNNFGPEALDAARTAAGLRLVTPLSGAVVLESREDYKKHGLDDGTEDAKRKSNKATKSNDSVAAPEPGTWLLMGLGLGCWVFVMGNKRLKRGVGVGAR